MPRHEYRDRSAATDRGAVSPRTASPRAPGVRWSLVAGLLLLAVLMPLSVTAVDLWSTTGSDLGATQRERVGVTYLGPLVTLLSATADAQSRAVAGGRPDTAAVQKAISGVDAAEAKAGVLAIGQRWTSARDRLNQLLKSPPTGTSAYTAFGAETDLLLALVSSVADSSTLILDPQLDTYYLMDASTLRLPGMIVSAGRMSDLAHLLGAEAAHRPEVAVAADRVRQDGQSVDSALAKAFAASSRTSLSKGLVPALDRFGDATAALVPPAAGYTFTMSSAAVVEAGRQRVRESALTLESATLSELDGSLATRADGVTSQRRVALAAAAAGALLALAVGWFVLPRRRRSHAQPADAPPAELVEWADSGGQRQLARAGRAAGSRDAR